MDFQKIPQLNKAQVYLDKALRQGRKVAASAKDSAKGNPYQRLKKVERERIKAVRDTISKDLNKILGKFPNTENISQFQKELMATVIDTKEISRILNKIENSERIIMKLSQDHLAKLKSTRLEIKDISRITKQYIGRVSSVVERLKADFESLEMIRKELKNLPNIDENAFTIAIAGFPNVGKSTLLSKMTTASPEINEYPFTTKGLNLGWLEIRFHRIQVIDTPGTLGRVKRNSIEERAELVIKHIANLIIYIFDPVEQYPLKDQIKLLNKIKKDVPVIIYISKKDIVEDEKIKQFLKEIKPKHYAENTEELKEFIKKVFKPSQPQ